MIRDGVTAMQLSCLAVLLFIFGILFKAAWRRKPKVDAQTFDEANEELGAGIAGTDSGAVPDAAIATNFQLLSVFPNVSFGIQGFIVLPFLNVLSFIFGNWITSVYFAPLLDAIKSHQSPHHYIADAHGAPHLRKFTAVVSLLVFLGVTCFELVYLSRVSRTLVGGGDESYFVLIGLLTLALLFVAGAGKQRATLAADRSLLLIAYIGMHAAIGFLIWFAVPKIDIATLGVLLLLICMSILRLRQLFARGSISRIRHAVILLSTVGLLLPMTWFAAFKVDWSPVEIRLALYQLSPIGSGLAPMTFALACAASVCGVLFYNFVDFSFWQKYLSEIRPHEPSAQAASRLIKPLWLYVIESPLSWLLPVILGIYAARVISADDAAARPIPAIIEFVYRTARLGPIVAIGLYAALVAIAVSTACGYIVSMVFLYRVDLASESTRKGSDIIPVAVIGVSLLLVLLPLDMLLVSVDQLIGLMLTSFAPLCGLTPLVVWPIMSNRHRVFLKPWAITALSLTTALSGIAGLATGIVSAALGAGPDRVLFWLPMPLSFSVAWVAYLFIVFAGERRHEVAK